MIELAADETKKMLPYHTQRAGELAQKVVFVKLRAALVLVKHGKLELLDLLEVIVHLKFHAKHWIQVIYGGLRSSQLTAHTNRGHVNSGRAVQLSRQHNRSNLAN